MRLFNYLENSEKYFDEKRKKKKSIGLSNCRQRNEATNPEKRKEMLIKCYPTAVHAEDLGVETFGIAVGSWSINDE